MDNLLTPVSTSYKKTGGEPNLSLVRQLDKAPPVTKQFEKARNPEEALEILRNEPDYESLVVTLHYLASGNSEFSITQPSPLAAQLVHVLVAETIPTYWSILRSASTGLDSQKQTRGRKLSDSGSLLYCLRSVTGLNAILLNLKQSVQKSIETKKVIGGPNFKENLTSYVEVLCQILEGDSTVFTIAKSIWSNPNSTSKQKATWSEFLSLLGSGKVLGISAQAEDVINEVSGEITEKLWISSGILYCTWLAQNIVHWAQILSQDDEHGWTLCAELMSRSFRLGHIGKILQ